MRVQRHTSGSVRFDKRRRTWNFLWYESGKRRSKLIGTKQEYPTKAAAWKAVGMMEVGQPKTQDGQTVRDVSTRYQAERMPTRLCTARVYRSFLNNHVLPKWGDTPIREVQPRPVELWLRELPLAPKSKTHVRSLLHSLVDFAMWAGILDVARNPISLVVNKGATKRVRKARSLTAEQFGALLSELHEPFATMALLCVCLGLRISEALALRWSDVDWLGATLSIRRGIVEQHVDDCKTEGSAKALVLADGLLSRLKAWKQASQFREAADWVFASPFSIGRWPYSYGGTRDELTRAAKASGIGPVSTHAFRHTYRSWLDATGAPVSVQQKMMRHASIKTTMDIYGDVVTDEMSTASRKVAELAFPSNGAQTERKAS
ncbi:MAG TPA: site-specific integrase [Terriglobales bacterium]|nr:site-specific integrase [Terriglobales bacterium]